MQPLLSQQRRKRERSELGDSRESFDDRPQHQARFPEIKYLSLARTYAEEHGN
jgi:hypothetical protein